MSNQEGWSVITISIDQETGSLLLGTLHQNPPEVICYLTDRLYEHLCQYIRQHGNELMDGFALQKPTNCH